MGTCFAFSSRWMSKKIVNDKESTRMILAVKLSWSTWTSHLTISNDPEADTDRKIINYVLKSDFIPPVQDKNGMHFKVYESQNNWSKRSVVFCLMSHERNSMHTVSKLNIRHIKTFTDTLWTGNSKLYNTNQLSISLNVFFVLSFSKLVCSK